MKRNPSNEVPPKKWIQNGSAEDVGTQAILLEIANIN